MQTTVANCTVAVWLGGSRQTERGEEQHELAQRETGALISDGLTGCVDRAVAQEEEKRCNGSTICLKTGAKQRSETHKKRGRGERTEREITEGREVIRSRERERAG